MFEIVDRRVVKRGSNVLHPKYHVKVCTSTSNPVLLSYFRPFTSLFLAVLNLFLYIFGFSEV